MDTILIVGAGPTGLALALTLVRAGVTPRIIDAGQGPSAQSRACALHARTLEVLGDEVASGLIALGKRLDRVELYGGEEELASLSLRGAPTAYDHSLALSQSVTERFLIGQLKARGVQIEWHTRLADLRHESDHVVATIVPNDGAHQRHAFDWVVGCDGVRSTARAVAHFALEVIQDPTWWLLADLRVDVEGLAPNVGRAYVSPEGMLLLLPLERAGWRRVVAIGDPEATERPEPDEATFRALLDARCPHPSTIHASGWMSAFRIQEHLVDRYRRGRVMLAGDAAHAHSPLGGQGMNTGIQDACNLGWKLALVAKGAHAPLLDSYGQERRPVGAELVRVTHRATRAAVLSNPWLIWLRNQTLHQLAKLDALNTRLRDAMEMLSVAYPDSSIVGEHSDPAEHLMEAPDRASARALEAVAGPGERAPLELAAVRAATDRSQHTVFLMDGPSDSPDGDVRIRQAAAYIADDPSLHPVAVVPSKAAAERLGDCEAEVLIDHDGAIHAAFGALSETAIVVRPDGYIGWRSQPIALDALLGWWTSVTGLVL